MEGQPPVIAGFAPGTMITTTTGHRDAQTLRAGDRVLTRDRGFQPITEIIHTPCPRAMQEADPALTAVAIRAGAFGPGLPAQDMIVAPHHGVLTTDPALLSPLDETEGLIAASAFVGRPGITRACPADITYIHLQFDRHEIILADTAWCESMPKGQAKARTVIALPPAPADTRAPRRNAARPANPATIDLGLSGLS